MDWLIIAGGAGLGVYFWKRLLFLQFVPDIYGEWNGGPWQNSLEVTGVNYGVNASVDLAAFWAKSDVRFPAGESSKFYSMIRPGFNGLIGERKNGDKEGNFFAMIGPGIEMGWGSPADSPFYWSSTFGAYGAFGVDTFNQLETNSGIQFGWKARVGAPLFSPEISAYYMVGAHWLTDPAAGTFIITPIGAGIVGEKCGVEVGIGISSTKEFQGFGLNVASFCNIMPYLRNLLSKPVQPANAPERWAVDTLTYQVPMPDPFPHSESNDEKGAPDPEPLSESQAEIQQNYIVIKNVINFETDKTDLLEESFSILDDVVLLLNQHPEIKKVQIQGHTDERESAAHNQKLSEDRADAVRKYLVRKGVAEDRLVSKGFGEYAPIDREHHEEAYRRNRRVVFEILERRTEP